MPQSINSDQVSQASRLADPANLRVKLSPVHDESDAASAEQVLHETKPLPLPQEVSPRPPTGEEGIDDGDVADYLSEEFAQNFKIDWEDESDPRIVELAQYGEMRSWIPGYTFHLKLKFCDDCVKHMLTHLTVVKQQNGMYLLKYFMCPNCVRENHIKLRG